MLTHLATRKAAVSYFTTPVQVPRYGTTANGAAAAASCARIQVATT